MSAPILSRNRQSGYPENGHPESEYAVELCKCAVKVGSTTVYALLGELAFSGNAVQNQTCCQVPLECLSKNEHVVIYSVGY